MDKEQLLVTAKQDMKKIVDDILFDTLRESNEQLFKYFSFLQELNNLPDIPTSIVLTKAEVDEAIIKAQEDFQRQQEEPEDTEQVKVAYRFERKTKGGFVPNAQAYVPERIVRELELENGDLVYAEKLGKQYEDGPTHFEFELAEHMHEPQPKDRVAVDYAVVEWDNFLKRFVANRTVEEGTIRDKDGAPQTLLISEQDAEELKLRDGDIVDLAYNINQPMLIRCIWRYSVDEPGETRLGSGSRRKSSDKVQREYPQTLVGKTILMVGFEPGRPTMEEEVNKRGGELIWSSGREGYDRMHSLVSKSDCVIKMLKHVSHEGTINAVDIAKDLGIPHGRIHTFGRSSFIQAVYKCLGIDSDD